MQELGEVLLQATQEAGLRLTDEQLKQFQLYGQLLVEWNAKVNLTAITDSTGIAVKHFVDSLLCSKHTDFDGMLKLLDVGSGAGFPGLPLKIYQENLEVTLMDSLMKRVKFLEEVIAQGSLQGIKAVHGRAEDFAHDQAYRERYDRVVSRAVAKLAVLAEYCMPFVKQGGLFLALKGSNTVQEVEEGLYAIEILGGRVKEIVNYQLPNSGDGRSIVIVEKIKNTPSKYPRKAGLPEKNPLSAKS